MIIPPHLRDTFLSLIEAEYGFVTSEEFDQELADATPPEEAELIQHKNNVIELNNLVD